MVAITVLNYDTMISNPVISLHFSGGLELRKTDHVIVRYQNHLMYILAL